ncbi:MAG: MFS transporter [Gammaproteobacteria bacterium]|nr:MFS transporter [Gammaproteobacteria bacterium]
MQNQDRRSRFSWMLYDWANSAFAVTVISGFFPLFFKQYWSEGTPVTTSTFYLGLGNSLASLVIVLAAPVLGALADHGGRRKRMLASLACVGILATSGLFFVQQGSWALAIALFFFGIIGFSGANIFYDSLLLAVAGDSDRHRLSAAGYAMGYLGGGLLFLVNVTMTLKPGWFGLAGTAEAVRWSFISVAIWWAVFSLPLLLWVREPVSQQSRSRSLITDAFSSIWKTLNSIRQNRNAWLFLLSYWLYIDGVATIIRMAVDYGLSIGLPSNSLITALLLVQFIGFPATLLFGRLAERIGARRGLWIGLWVYVAATTYAVFMDSSLEFYILAVALGLVQGGVQSLSRSLFSHLIPPEKNGEYFGFLNMMGKAAAVVGPVLVGFIAFLTEDPRLGIWSILILFFAGMWLLRYVDDPTENR